MKRVLTYVLILLMTGCTSVPITHRKQLNLVSHYQILDQAREEYKEFLNTHSVVSPYDERTIMVRRVTDSIVMGVNRFVDEHGGQERIAGYMWEVNLVEGEDANAFCLPGGKIVVYTGILEYVETDADLAVVISHEVAHAFAQHGRESASQQVLAQSGEVLLTVLSTALNYKYPELNGVIEAGYQISTGLGLLRFSRAHETEADKMGMVFMEYGGFDCRAVEKFWMKMERHNTYDGPQLLSTHPLGSNRLVAIKEFMPIAKSYVP